LYRKPQGRYITVTGNQLADSPSALANIDEEMDRLKAEFGTAASSASGGIDVDLIFNRLVLERIAADDPRLENLSQEWIKLGTTGEGIVEKYGGHRSRAVFGFSCECLRQGVSENVTASCLWYWKIGDHIRDQRNPRRALVRVIVKASAAAQNFTKDRKGNITKTQRNVRIALARFNIDLSYDAFHDVMLIEGLEGHSVVDDATVEKLWLMVDQKYHFLTAKDFFFVVVEEAARRNIFHPVRDYLDALTWDGVERLDNWLVTYGGAQASDYVKAVGAITLIAAVRRVRHPGCKFDEMMILESEQGMDKSNMLATMAVKEDWFTDDLPLYAKSREAIEQTRGRWIVEAADMSGMRQAEVEQLKAFLSRQVDRGRMAYDRLVTDYPRQYVVVGTTNAEVYLQDTTGNRRFWPVKVSQFKIGDLSRDRDQIWAEAAHREAHGASIRLDPRLWNAASVEQHQRTVDEPWLEIIKDALSDTSGNLQFGSVLSDDIWNLVGMEDRGRRNQNHNRRIGNIMKSLGFKRDHITVERKYGYFYSRGNPEQVKTRIHVPERF
jgi:hypothetical protein